MHLHHVTNAPLPLVLGGTTYRCRSLTLGQIGEILAWLEDRAGVAVLFSSEASRVALATTEGLGLLLHLSLEHHHPRLTREDATALAATMDAEDEGRLLGIAFRRMPSKPADPDDTRPAKDLAQVCWGEIFEWLSGHTASGYAAAASLTLDQFDNFSSRGEGWDPDELDPRDVQRMYEEAKAREEDEVTDV